LKKNISFLKNKINQEVDQNKSLIMENFVEINEGLLLEKEDFTFYLYFEYYNEKDEEEIEYNLNILKNIGLDINKSTISKKQLLTKVLGHATAIKEHKNFFSFETGTSKAKKASINKIDFNGINLGEL